MEIMKPRHHSTNSMLFPNSSRPFSGVRLLAYLLMRSGIPWGPKGRKKKKRKATKCYTPRKKVDTHQKPRTPLMEPNPSLYTNRCSRCLDTPVPLVAKSIYIYNLDLAPRKFRRLQFTEDEGELKGLFMDCVAAVVPQPFPKECVKPLCPERAMARGAKSERLEGS